MYHRRHWLLDEPNRVIYVDFAGTLSFSTILSHVVVLLRLPVAEVRNVYNRSAIADPRLLAYSHKGPLCFLPGLTKVSKWNLLDEDFDTVLCLLYPVLCR